MYVCTYKARPGTPKNKARRGFLFTPFVVGRPNWGGMGSITLDTLIQFLDFFLFFSQIKLHIIALVQFRYLHKVGRLSFVCALMAVAVRAQSAIQRCSRLKVVQRALLLLLLLLHLQLSGPRPPRIRWETY